MNHRGYVCFVTSCAPSSNPEVRKVMLKDPFQELGWQSIGICTDDIVLTVNKGHCGLASIHSVSELELRLQCSHLIKHGHGQVTPNTGQTLLMRDQDGIPQIDK
jgi:hypothetical protein